MSKEKLSKILEARFSEIDMQQDADRVPIKPVLEKLAGIMLEVADERKRQDLKWGEQNHPSVDQVLTDRKGGCTPERMAEEYELPSENRAKQMTDNAMEKGTITFAHIAVEELVEAVCSENDTKRRVELVQLGAVILQWIEAIDRKANLKCPCGGNFEFIEREGWVCNSCSLTSIFKPKPQNHSA